MREKNGKFLFPARGGSFFGDSLSFGRGKILGPGAAPFSAANASQGNSMGISCVRLRLSEGPAVHLLANGLFHNATRNFHEVALRSRFLRHDLMMPRIH